MRWTIAYRGNPDRPRTLLALVAPLPVAVATAAGLALDAGKAVEVLLLLVAVTAAALFGRGPGLVAAVAASASLSYFFTPPVDSFSFGKRQDGLALIAFAFVSIIVSSLLSEAIAAKRGEAEAAAREAHATSEAALARSRAAFFAAAGHNLRTPLASLKAAAEAAAMCAAVDDDDCRALLDGLVAEVDRLEALVARILQLSRLRGATAVLDLEAGVDIEELVQTAVERARGQSAHHRWTVEVDPLPAGLLVDPLAVAQVLLNLLENAVRFAPSGTEISVLGRALAGGYDLAVADRGPGVEATLHAEVFEPFHGGDQTAASGAGLGLAIAAGLVEAHGGVLRIDETPGGGATFVATFPGAP